MSDIREGDRVECGDYFNSFEGIVDNICGPLAVIELDNGNTKLVHLTECTRLTVQDEFGNFINPPRTNNNCSCGAKHTNNPNFHLSYCNKA